MADKNQLKIADQVDLADDDPFAELTRIMGFDPRQPAKQAAPAPEPEPVSEQAEYEQVAAEQAEDDDFSLDLEKELLGGFDVDDEQPAAAFEEPEEEAPVAQQADHAAAAPQAPESDLAEVDFDFSGVFDSATAEAEAVEAAAAADPEPGFDEGFDAAADIGAATAYDDLDFDLGLSDEEVRVLDEAAAPPALPVTPEAVAREAEIAADLDAAISDMDFLAETPAAEPVAAAALDEAEPTAEQAAEADDADLGLFDEGDFRLDDEPAPAEAGPQDELEIDESAFGFEDALSVDSSQATDDAVAEPTLEDELAFDAADLAVDDLDEAGPGPDDAGIPRAEQAEPAEVEPTPGDAADPLATALDWSAVPPAPRKLPVSPMDIAADEFRQREAAAAPAEPEFNLEDELNALLGNMRAIQEPAEAGRTEPAASVAPEPSFEPAPSFQVPAYAPPSFGSTAFQPPASSSFGSSGNVPFAQPSYRAPEPAGFDAPQHPADIDDNLNWELDTAFATDAAPEQAQRDSAEAYAEEPADDYQDAFAADNRFGGYADEDAEPAPIDLDEVFNELADDFRPDAAAGAAAGDAARFDSGFASRPFETERAAQPAWAPDPAPREPSRVGAHRDPVVRGNPLKEDPLDVITQLAERYSRKEPITPYGRAMSVAAGAAPAAYGDEDRDDSANGDIDISDAFEEQPDVETVEVSDRAVALADDFDIPELPEDEDLPPASTYDDLDAEFSSLLSDLNSGPQAAQPANGRDDPLAGGFHTRPYENKVVATSYGARPAARDYEDDIPAQGSFVLHADNLQGGMQYGVQYGADDYQFDSDFDEKIAPQPFADERRRTPKSRGLMLAGVIGGVALVGALGALALSYGDGGDDTPAIVRADDGPIKVKPENPGGATVPNQDSKVYETVAGQGNADALPQQEKLVTTAEEPMDVMPPAVEEEASTSASGKSEDRIEQIVQDAENQTDAEIVAVAPRKVRTMVVKPDGTLVPRDDEPEATSGEQTEAIAAATPQAAPAPVIPESTGTTADQADDEAAPAEEMQAAADPAPQPQAAAEVAAEERITMPDTAPIVPLRPADQPIDVVGEVQPDQVATASAAGGGWAMQIASQPSEAAAQSSYKDLVNRHPGVLQGREVNIVKADIAGKGTFWRVRVPAGSRNEAISLCETYKAAGGNCFVSR